MEVGEERNQLPFDVTVKQPDAWIVSAEAKYYIAIRIDQDGISSHGSLWELDAAGVRSLMLRGSLDHLKVVAVKMEGMLSRIVVVQYNLNHLAFVEHKRIAIDAINFRVCRKVSG